MNIAGKNIKNTPFLVEPVNKIKTQRKLVVPVNTKKASGACKQKEKPKENNIMG